MADTRSVRDGFGDADLASIEAAHPEGLTVQQIVEIFAARGEKLTEATFRKYVQLGLLPRSFRVARKGKRRGSQGLYPVGAVRQVGEVRRLMGQGYTMEEIQREFLFIRGDLEELNRHLDKIFASVERVLAERDVDEAADDFAARNLEEARALGAQLQARLEGIEKRISMRARMARAAV